jgi:hypothetical protein
MIVKIRYEEELEVLEMPMSDIQTFIDLVKAHGYEDSEGTIYEFQNARVEYPRTVMIYLETDAS